MAVVVSLLMCGWISIINAQPNTVTILPQKHQSVCHGESISFNCIGSGTSMALFSPPVVNESNPLALFSSQSIQTCIVMPNIAASIVLVDSTGSPSFIGTFTLYISDGQSEGQLTVYCRVSSADGMITANETTFSVLGAPNPATSLTFQETVALSEDMAQVPVNVSWDSPENAQEFMLQIKNTGYKNTIRSLENSVTVLLPRGTYSATLCTINRCGKTCQDFSNIFSAEPQPISKDNTSLIAAAVVAGILGFLFILASIYGIAVTVIICMKNNA